MNLLYNRGAGVFWEPCRLVEVVYVDGKSMTARIFISSVLSTSD